VAECVPANANHRPRVHLTARAVALSERLARAAGRQTPAFEGRPLAPPRDELPSGTMAGPYRVDGPIGRGGMAVVYQARGPRGLVALKVARPEDDPDDPQCRDRLLLEALVLEKLDHPAIARLHDVGELPDGRPWLALELVRGEPLNHRLGDGPLPIDETCALLAELAGALASAHAVGVVHRDLKPDNVLVVPRGLSRCKLVDWGVARSRALPHARITEVGVVSGTPLYMSPEQARGLEVDGRCDIYSLGVMAYELLCGEPPFDADDSVSILLQHVSDRPRRPSLLRPDLPAWLDELVLAMLAKHADDRPSLDEIGAALGGRRRRRRLGEVLAELEAELRGAGIAPIEDAA
jgi:eukaryotic-like serine/threonine-protein kinase